MSYKSPQTNVGVPNNDTVTSAKIVDGAVVNEDINSSAAIALSKLADLTASRALVSDTNGDVSAATTTSTEIGYVNGVTSAIQTQIDSKAASSHTHALAAGATDVTATSTELNYVDGVTSAIQTQIDGKITAVTSTDEAIVRYNGTSGAVQNSAVTINDSGVLAGTAIAGTYTPNGTSTTNLEANSPQLCSWIRIGNVVSGEIAITLNPTSAGGTATVCTLTLPIACVSTPTGGGSINNSEYGQVGEIIMASATTMTINYNAQNAGNTAWRGTYQYVVN